MKVARDLIITLPNVHLRTRSSKVGYITPKIKELAEEMILATLDWEDNRQHELGVALAAIQIDQPLRLIVVRKDFEKKEDREFEVYINPEITKFEGDKIADMEGCLSIPDVYGKVERYEKVRLRAKTLQGKEIRLTAEGFLARVLQHEVDHTNGIVFVDHIKNNPDAFYKLNESGELENLDYEKNIRTNSILW